MSFHEWNHFSRIFVLTLDIRVPFSFFFVFHFSFSGRFVYNRTPGTNGARFRGGWSRGAGNLETCVFQLGAQHLNLVSSCSLSIVDVAALIAIGYCCCCCRCVVFWCFRTDFLLFFFSSYDSFFFFFIPNRLTSNSGAR